MIQYNVTGRYYIASMCMTFTKEGRESKHLIVDPEGSEFVIVLSDQTKAQQIVDALNKEQEQDALNKELPYFRGSN